MEEGESFNVLNADIQGTKIKFASAGNEDEHGQSQ
jgi:hypothetical protein